MTRRVEPLGVLYGMRHYLAAVADGSSEPALWALLDIEAVRHEASVITKPPGFDLAVFAARSFGVHQEEPFDVVWRFSPAVAEDARSYQFHPSQTSEEQAEGAVVVRFTAGGAEEQDFKLRVGDKPKRAATLEAAGEILLLDEDDGRVGLKIGPKAPPFEEAFSIIPSGPIDTSTLRDAVYRFADSVIAGDGRYSAITSILKREHPRIAGRQPGAAIVSEKLESVGEAAIAISRLDHSHMLVQGPPGAGWRARNFRPVAIWVAKTATDPATARTSIVTATGRSAFSASSPPVGPSSSSTSRR